MREFEEDHDPDVPRWQTYGSCRGVDPDLFFPERGASTREAKEVCRGCVVRDECLEYALANGEKFGIWGGMSERERRRVRRQRAIIRKEERAVTRAAEAKAKAEAKAVREAKRAARLTALAERPVDPVDWDDADTL